MKADNGPHKGMESIRKDGTYSPGMKNDRTQQPEHKRDTTRKDWNKILKEKRME